MDLKQIAQCALKELDQQAQASKEGTEDPVQRTWHVESLGDGLEIWTLTTSEAPAPIPDGSRRPTVERQGGGLTAWTPFSDAGIRIINETRASTPEQESRAETPQSPSLMLLERRQHRVEMTSSVVRPPMPASRMADVSAQPRASRVTKPTYALRSQNRRLRSSISARPYRVIRFYGLDSRHNPVIVR